MAAEHEHGDEVERAVDREHGAEASKEPPGIAHDTAVDPRVQQRTRDVVVGLPARVDLHEHVLENRSVARRDARRGESALDRRCCNQVVAHRRAVGRDGCRRDARHALDPVGVLARNRLGGKQPREHDLPAAQTEEEHVAVRDADAQCGRVLVVGCLEATHEHSESSANTTRFINRHSLLRYTGPAPGRLPQQTDTGNTARDSRVPAVLALVALTLWRAERGAGEEARLDPAADIRQRWRKAQQVQDEGIEEGECADRRAEAERVGAGERVRHIFEPESLLPQCTEEEQDDVDTRADGEGENE